MNEPPTSLREPEASRASPADDVFREALAAFTAPTIEGHEVVRLLGQGAQARVYLARDAQGREVAIKRWLDPDVDLMARERVHREVEVLQRVSHENLVRLRGVTKDDRDAPCLVLELVDGTSLAELIRQAGRLEPERAAEIGVALARGVGALHAHGVLHRDVKPSNVVVRHRDKAPVLIDLGIALARGPAPRPEDGPPRAVEATPGLGTFPYMAPEQLGAEVPGAPAPPIDERADIYALGALLFECATGFPPWTNQGPWVRKNRSPWDEPVHPEVKARARDVPDALRRIIARCLEGDPAARTASCEALEQELLAFLAGRAAERTSEPALARHRTLTLAVVRLVDASPRLDLRALIAECDGHALPSTGDAVCASFEAPSVAVAFGLRLLWRRAQDRTLPRLRVGVHWGEVGDAPLSGPAHEVADLLSMIAAPDQLLVSGAVFDEARQWVRLGPGLPEVAWRAYGPYRAGERELSIAEAGLPGVSALEPPPESSRLTRLQAQDQILGWRPAPGLMVPRRPHWALARKLGEGGFGEVWLATHAMSHDRRAFKFCFRADRLRQLKREVILFTVLRDTLDKRWDIAQILDWQFEEAPYFIESEYSSNGSLVDWSEAKGGLANVPLESRLELLAQVAEALAAAHGAGILHQDVKPQNVLIQSFGAAVTAQLADFGVGVAPREDARVGAAMKAITAASATEVWAAGGGEGFSRLYMAPELLEGAPASKRSDIYALGVMLYQVVRGDFSRALGAGWERYIDDPLLRDDIGACVDSDPARRLGSAEELAERLRALDERRAAWQAGEQARRETTLLREREELVRARRRWLLLVLAFALLALWGFVDARRWRREAQELQQRLDGRGR